ncbi:MAG: AI-2E family transporter [Spirochaetaceae bacterium]
MRDSDRYMLEGVFILVLVAFSVAFYRVMAPFILDIFIALVLTNIFGGVYRWFLSVTGQRKRLSAALTLLVTIVTVAIPVTLVALLLYGEIAGGVANVQQWWPEIAATINSLTSVQSIDQLPLLSRFSEFLPDLDLTQIIRNAVTTGSNVIVALTQRSFANVTQAVFRGVIVLLLMFFFYLDGDRVVRKTYETIPLPKSEIEQITLETFNTTSATLISTVIIGLMEGTLAAVLFLIFGLPSPFLWGAITVVLSMIPLIGTNLILFPAGIIQIAMGRVVAGIIMLIGGAVGVAITQNLIKPKLLGDRSGLHPAIALLATIGGIAWLGLIGFLIGPVIASLFFVVWRQFGQRYRTLLETKEAFRDQSEE